MAAAFIAMGWPDRTSTLERYLSEQQAGTRPMFVARVGKDFAGYVTLNWRSSYEPFASAGIPEIKDLNVVESFRRRGIATALVDQAEALVSTRSELVGIGVGMYPDYGPAQRMYVLRGYVPDGRGLTYQDHTVTPMEQVTVDDDLVLFFSKRLR